MSVVVKEQAVTLVAVVVEEGEDGNKYVLGVWAQSADTERTASFSSIGQDDTTYRVTVGFSSTYSGEKTGVLTAHVIETDGDAPVETIDVTLASKVYSVSPRQSPDGFLEKLLKKGGVTDGETYKIPLP